MIDLGNSYILTDISFNCVSTPESLWPRTIKFHASWEPGAEVLQTQTYTCEKHKMQRNHQYFNLLVVHAKWRSWRFCFFTAGLSTRVRTVGSISHKLKRNCSSIFCHLPHLCSCCFCLNELHPSPPQFVLYLSRDKMITAYNVRDGTQILCTVTTPLFWT